MTGKGQAINHQTKAHSRIAAGTAIAKPRAKLRFGPKRGSGDTERPSVGKLVMATTLSISRIPLLPLSNLIQPANRKATCPTRNNSRAAIGLHSVGNMLEVGGLVLRLAWLRNEQREYAAPSVIYVASSRPRQGGRPSLTARLIIPLVLFATPRIAAAQAEPEKDEVVTPTDIFDPERGRGLSISGGLVLYNRTRIEGIYDTNIYNVEQNRTKDTLARIETDFRLSTRLSRHEFELQTGGALRRYAKTSEENSETYYVYGRTFLDFGGRIAVRARGGYVRGIEMRGTAGDQFASDRPLRFNDTNLEVSADRTGGILEAGVTGTIQRRKYLNTTVNGITVDLGPRDATIKRIAVRASYRVSPVIRVYSQFGGNEVRYDENLGIPRDSHGYSLLVGARYEVTRLIDVTAAVGYMRQHFDAPGVKPASGLSYKLAGTWSPTPMWRVTASGERVVDSSPLSNVPAIVRGNFDLKVQRALGNRMLVEAGVSYIDEKYNGLSGTDRRYAGYGNVHYRITNNIGAVVEAGYRKQTGGASGRSYNGAWVSAGLRIAL